jgi:hypothetical protein
MQGVQVMNIYHFDRVQVFDKSKKKVTETPEIDQKKNQTT